MCHEEIWVIIVVWRRRSYSIIRTVFMARSWCFSWPRRVLCSEEWVRSLWSKCTILGCAMDMASLSLCPRISLSTLHSQAGSSISAVQRFSMGGLGSGSERFSTFRSSGKLLRLSQASQKFRNRRLAMLQTSTPVIGNPNSQPVSILNSLKTILFMSFIHVVYCHCISALD